MYKLIEIFKEAKTPIDYIFAIWVWALLGISVLGLSSVFYTWITNPQEFFNISF
jgi:hypothetical protein